MINKREYKFSDLTFTDIKLLGQAYNLNQKEFLCFGKSFEKLYALKLIHDDNTISYNGIKFLKTLNLDV